MCSSISLEAESSAEHRRTRRTGHHVAAAQTVEVIRVAQIIEVHPEVEVAVYAVRRHRLDGVVAVHPSSADVIAEPLADKARTTAHRKLAPAIGCPDVEGIARRVLNALA